MFIIVVFVIALFMIGVLESRIHSRNLNSIPIKINVNGIRGKSTVTRLITWIIAEAGINTLGKTTGTCARILYPSTQNEVPILRKPQGANISEQKMVVAEGVKLRVDALVSECMALKPDYQKVFQEKLLKANIGIIVNVLEDHLDVMGPTLDEVADAFSSTIPYDGYLIIGNGPYKKFFRRLAKKRRTKVIIADTTKVPMEYIRRFNYVAFPENVAFGLALAKVLGIDEKTALRGMLKANPDPGALKIIPLILKNRSSYFVNGFAANDPTSTVNIWRHIERMGIAAQEPVIIINSRSDRIDRNEQMITKVIPYIKTDTLIIIGSGTKIFMDAHKSGEIEFDNIHCLEGKSVNDIIDTIEQNYQGRIVYGIGNIHGIGQELVDYIEYCSKNLSVENERIAK